MIARSLCFKRLNYDASQFKNGIAGNPGSNPSVYEGFVEFATPITVKKFI
jgi:hypothetical protein